jgi:hypothetical protein
VLSPVPFPKLCCNTILLAGGFQAISSPYVIQHPSVWPITCAQSFTDVFRYEFIIVLSNKITDAAAAYDDDDGDDDADNAHVHNLAHSVV